MVAFVSEVVKSYQPMALKRNIDLRLITDEKQMNVWFDVNMMDKVIFNLLSNAFKFTKEGGYVYVHLQKDETANQVMIKVEDNGTGMTEEEANNAFEIFYQGKNEGDMGTGLGLSLSKELINLHQGSISVKSKKWVGTTFEIRLPLGKEHLQPNEIISGHISTTRTILPAHPIEFEPVEPQQPIQPPAERQRVQCTSN